MRLLGASGTRLAQTESVDETNAADGDLDQQDAWIIYLQFLMQITQDFLSRLSAETPIFADQVWSIVLYSTVHFQIISRNFLWHLKSCQKDRPPDT